MAAIESLPITIKPGAARYHRRFWQIHLSTAIVLMFVAGGMVWLNCRRHFTINSDMPPYFVHFGWIERGWPLTAYRVEAGLWRRQDYERRAASDPDIKAALEQWPNLKQSEAAYYLQDEGIVTSFHRDETLFKQGVAVDSIAAFGILAFVSLACEWLIRRREARKR